MGLIEKGYVHIFDGSIAVDSGDDAIKAITSLTVDGGVITVTDSVEGMEATNITINDGEITIAAIDDGINAVSQGLGGEVFITVTGGSVNVTVGTGDTDGFDSNGSITISGGTVDVTAPGMSSLDYETTGQLTGGTLIVNGQELTQMPASMTGGPAGGAAGRAGGFDPSVR